MNVPTKHKLLEALDAMDDYARMDTGVDAYGPREVLRRYIESLPEQGEAVAVFDERLGRPVMLSHAPMLKDEQLLYTSPPPTSDDRRDAERYRYLTSILHITDNDHPISKLYDGLKGEIPTKVQLDEAIDAAITSEKD